MSDEKGYWTECPQCHDKCFVQNTWVERVTIRCNCGNVFNHNIKENGHEKKDVDVAGSTGGVGDKLLG